MLDHWLAPLRPSDGLNANEFAEYQLGAHVVRWDADADPAELAAGSVALVGLDAAEADRVRGRLYAMAYPGGDIAVVDLGNARKPGGAVNAPVMQELLSAGVVPVFLGREADRALAQYYGYHHAEYLTNLVVVDDRACFDARAVPDEKAYLDHVFDLTPVRLFHLALLAYQTHYTDPATLEYLHQHHFEFYRLGLVKHGIDEAEPVLRDADAVVFQLPALKAADAPAKERAGGSGLTSEEACQLCRFAGMADKVTSFGVYGYLAERDASAQTADVIAQLVWYFVEGVANRKYDFPASTEGLSEYVVQLDGQSAPLSFWKSERSGRWWMRVPYGLDGDPRHQYVPCTYADYLTACDQRLPDRLVEAYKRFV